MTSKLLRMRVKEAKFSKEEGRDLETETYNFERVGNDLYAVNKYYGIKPSSGDTAIQLVDEQYVKNFVTSTVQKVYDNEGNRWNWKETGFNGEGGNIKVVNGVYGYNWEHEYGAGTDGIVTRCTDNLILLDPDENCQTFSVEDRSTGIDVNGEPCFEEGTRKFLFGDFEEKIDDSWNKKRTVEEFFSEFQEIQIEDDGFAEGVLSMTDNSFMAENFALTYIDYNYTHNEGTWNGIIAGADFYKEASRRLDYLIEFGGLGERTLAELKDWQDAAFDAYIEYQSQDKEYIPEKQFSFEKEVFHGESGQNDCNFDNEVADEDFYQKNSFFSSEWYMENIVNDIESQDFSGEDEENFEI